MQYNYNTTAIQEFFLVWQLYYTCADPCNIMLQYKFSTTCRLLAAVVKNFIVVVLHLCGPIGPIELFLKCWKQWLADLRTVFLTTLDDSLDMMMISSYGDYYKDNDDEIPTQRRRSLDGGSRRRWADVDTTTRRCGGSTWWGCQLQQQQQQQLQ